MKISFSKMHALSNDFVVIDAIKNPVDLTPAIVRYLADRKRGVGCDQLLVLAPSQETGIDFEYRIYNATGEAVGQCGNGARALAVFIARHYPRLPSEIKVATLSSQMTLVLQSDGRVAVNMGAPRWEPSAIPLALPFAEQFVFEWQGKRWDYSALSVGNPHAVFSVSGLASMDIQPMAEALQASGIFPEGVNVGFLERLSRSHVLLRVYERGVGETAACGSGACAAVAAGQRLGLLAESVEVEQAGGVLTVSRDSETQTLWMTGPAVHVFDGEIEIMTENESL